MTDVFFFHDIRFKVSLDTLRSDTRSIFIYIILYHIRYNFGQFVKYITDCLFVYIIEYTEFYINSNIKLKYKNNSKENIVFDVISSYNYYLDTNCKKGNEDYII